MESEQREEFARLESQALRLLHDEPSVMSLLMVPSFEDPQLVAVRETARKVPEVIWRRWRRGLDREKYRTPVERLRNPREIAPLIESRSASLDANWLSNARKDLQSLRVPALSASRQLVLDGTAFELRANLGSSSSHFRWWQEGPSEWRPMTLWFRETWIELTSHCNPTRSPEHDH